MDKEWFATWFDSPYYHMLYRSRNTAEAQEFVDCLAEKLHITGGTKALDLACGKGRHVKALVDMGMETIGYDLSENSINSAREKVPEAIFRVHDMREPFKDKGFNVVFNLFTSFGYFCSTTENLQVLNNIKQALAPGGRLVIDFINTRKAVRQLVPNEVKEINGITFHISRTVLDGHIIKTIEFNDQGHAYTFEENVQALYLTGFTKLLNVSGFTLLNTFGNYKLHPFDAVESDRLIMIAELQ